MATATRSTYQIVNALNAEWQALADGHRGTVAAWADRHMALTACDTLGSVLAAVPARPDAVLGAMLAEAVAGGQLAGRTVLQAMLGKLVRMAQRDSQSGIDDYVSAMWCRICKYPLQRRPQRIAANLALDTLKDVVAERASARREMLTPWPPEVFLDTLLGVGASPTGAFHDDLDELSVPAVLRAACRLGLVDDDTQAVLQSVYGDGLSSRGAAERHQTSPDMIRFRCSKAVRRLAKHASQLADAA